MNPSLKGDASMNASRIKNVLMIDIPTYNVVLPDLHRALIEKRLRLQSVILEERVGKKLIRPGLTYSRGLLILAACLERDGFNVKYLVHADPYDRTRILELAKDADAVCVTAMTPAFYIARDIIDSVKNVNRRCITVIGGPHVNSVFENALREAPEIDFAIVGESELRLSLLLRDPNNPSDIGGVIYRDGEQIITTKLEFSSPIVSELPMPAYNLLSRPLSEYAHNIKTLRGCPYKCSFCAERLSWTSLESSSHEIEQVINELKLIRRAVESNSLVHFSDAIFNLNWERTSELLERIRFEIPDIFFSCDTRVDLIKEEHIKEFNKSRMVYVRMGFESFHNNILKISEKSSTFKIQKDASKLIRETSKHIGIHAYMVTGLPGTTRESLSMDTVEIQRMIEKGLVDIVGNKILVPYPGTPFHENANGLGLRILTKDWNKYDRRSFPTFDLLNLSAEEIYFGYLNQEAALNNAYEQSLA